VAPVHITEASGGFVGAIILYETALGPGIAVGPLLGGLLVEAASAEVPAAST
jgi:hypothetical protein